MITNDTPMEASPKEPNSIPHPQISSKTSDSAAPHVNKPGFSSVLCKSIYSLTRLSYWDRGHQRAKGFRSLLSSFHPLARTSTIWAPHLSMEDVHFSALYGALAFIAAIIFIRWRRTPVSTQDCIPVERGVFMPSTSPPLA